MQDPDLYLVNGDDVKAMATLASCNPTALQPALIVGDAVLDFFAGSGTTGVAAHQAGRSFVLVDRSKEAIAVASRRFEDLGIPYRLG